MPNVLPVITRPAGSAPRRFQLSLAILALTALAIVGCGSCGKDEPGVLPPAKVTLLSASLAGLQAPGDVLAYGGTGPLQKSLGEITALGTKAGLPLPPIESQAGVALQAELALKDDKALDLRQGLRFAVLNPKVHTTAPLALLVGITSKDAFTAALREDKKAEDEGNAFSYPKFPGSTEILYVNFVATHVVVTRDRTLFPKYREFLERLAYADVEPLGGVVVAMKNLTAIYGEDLEAGLVVLKKQIRGFATTTPGMEQQIWLFDALADAVAAAAKELDDIRLTVGMAPSGDGIKAELSFQPKAGTDLATSVAALRGPGTGALLARLPADSPFFAWVNIAPDRLQAWSKKLAGVTVGAMLKGDPAKQAEYDQAMIDAITSMGGEYAVAAHAPVKGDGLAFTTLFNVTDAAKARSAQARLTGVYKEPGAVEYYKRAGLQVDMQPAAYTVGDVPVSVITTKMDGSNPKLAVMNVGLAELLTQHIALGKDLGVLAYGSDARDSVEAVLGGKMAGGLNAAPGAARALKLAAANPIVVVYVSPADVARRVRMGGMNPFAEMLKGIEATSGIALSVGTEAGALKVVLDVPTEQVQKIGQVVQKMKGSL